MVLAGKKNRRRNTSAGFARVPPLPDGTEKEPIEKRIENDSRRTSKPHRIEAATQDCECHHGDDHPGESKNQGNVYGLESCRPLVRNPGLLQMGNDNSRQAERQAQTRKQGGVGVAR